MDFSKYLTNKQIRRQIQFWAIVIGFVLIPLIYAVIANDFMAKIQAAIEAGFEVTGLGIIGIIVGSLFVWNFKVQAVDDVRNTNDDIDKSFNDVYIKKNEISQDQIPKCLEYMVNQNDIAQEDANVNLTQLTITQYKNKLTKAQINGNTRKIKRIERKIEKLQQNNLLDKKFKGLKPKDVLYNKSGIFNSQPTYRQQYVDNPTSTNWFLKIFTTPLKFLTLGGTLVSGFAFGISWQALLLFYAALIVTTGLTSLLVYFLVTYRVVNKTYRANLNMIEYIDDMMKYVKREPLPFDDLSDTTLETSQNQASEFYKEEK